MEDRADQAGDHLQTADLGHHRGEDLPQVTSSNDDKSLCPFKPELMFRQCDNFLLTNGLSFLGESTVLQKLKLISDINVKKPYRSKIIIQVRSIIYVKVVTSFNYEFLTGKSSNSS